MQELVNVMNQTPIEIALGIDKDGMTTARNFMNSLDLHKDNFQDGVKEILQKMILQ